MKSLRRWVDLISSAKQIPSVEHGFHREQSERFHYSHVFLTVCIFVVHTQKEKHCDSGAFLFGNDVCLRQMMLAKPMMTASPNDVCLRAHGGKHRIIASETSNIMQAKRLVHHIREANASFLK